MDGGIERIGQLSFRQWAAPAAVRDAVASVWRAVARTDTTLRLVPDGCVEIVRSSTGSVQVFGPATRWRDLQLSAGADHTGVRLRVGAAAAALLTDLEPLRDHVVDAEAANLPAERAQRPDRAAWFAPLWRLIVERTVEHPRDPLVAVALQLLAEPRARVGPIAELLSVSERHLRRRFELATGIPPTTYRRLVRLNVALAHLRAGRQPAAAVAHACGYADQAHLNREVLELTGQTPGTFHVAG